MTVHFDGLFSTGTGTGRTGRLTYVWDFGDGTYGTGGRVTHTYHRPAFADVRLVVADGKGHRSGYRQAVKMGAPMTAAPPTSSCGRLSTTDMTALIPHRSAGANTTTLPWQPTADDYTDPTPVSAPQKAPRPAKPTRPHRTERARRSAARVCSKSRPHSVAAALTAAWEVSGG